METPSVPVRTKRGCLWYFAACAVIGVAGLLTLFFVEVFSEEFGQSRYAILVFVQQQTFLEVVTHSYTLRENGEGFLADYNTHTDLTIYYVREGGWFKSERRAMVLNLPGSGLANISISRHLTKCGQVKFEVKRPMNWQEINQAASQSMPRYNIYPNGEFSSAVSGQFVRARRDSIEARRKSGRDSVLLTEFIPPTVF